MFTGDTVVTKGEASYYPWRREDLLQDSALSVWRDGRTWKQFSKLIQYFCRACLATSRRERFSFQIFNGDGFGTMSVSAGSLLQSHDPSRLEHLWCWRPVARPSFIRVR